VVCWRTPSRLKMSRVYSFNDYKIKVTETLNEEERWKKNSWGSYDKIFKVIEGESPGKINLNEQVCFGNHRSGWSYVLDTLAPLHKDEGIFFDSFIERNFSWTKKTKTYTEDWIGVLHNPPFTPDWFFGFNSLEKIIPKPEFQESLERCRGFFTLSTDLAEYVQQETGIHTQPLIHPTEIPDKIFNFDKFLENKDKKIFLIGYWLRNMLSLFLLPLDDSSGYRKMRLLPYSGESPIKTINYFLIKQKEIYGKDVPAKYNDNTYDLNRLSNEAYDNLFVDNVMFLDLYASSANNGVIEAIARATPTLINKLPATIEYFGKDYPLFFDTLEEAAAKALDYDLIEKAHQYLLTCETRSKLDGNYFKNSLEESSIYQSL